MSETSYVIDLTPDGENRYRHFHVLKNNQIVEFRIQYEAYIIDKWYAIVRYDSAHGFAHRDLIHPNGTETKTTFQHWDDEQVLIYGERDLKQNWMSYRQNFAAKLAQGSRRRRKS